MINKRKQQQWLIIEEGDFVVVIPDWDMLPHGVIKNGNIYELSGSECSCKPKVQLAENYRILIAHNSFLDKKRIDESMEKYG